MRIFGENIFIGWNTFDASTDEYLGSNFVVADNTGAFVLEISSMGSVYFSPTQPLKKTDDGKYLVWVSGHEDNTLKIHLFDIEGFNNSIK